MPATSETEIAEIKNSLQYDPETGRVVWLKAGSGNRLAGKTAGCRRADGYVLIRVGAKLRGAHRIAVILMTGSDPIGVVDHINGDPSDNRWSNLRVCSQRNNRANSKTQTRPKSSKYKGVTWFAQRKKWMAKICVNYKTRTLGYFDNEHDAALAYNRAARETFGDFARMNEVDRASNV